MTAPESAGAFRATSMERWRRTLRDAVGGRLGGPSLLPRQGCIRRASSSRNGQERGPLAQAGNCWTCGQTETRAVRLVCGGFGPPTTPHTSPPGASGFVFQRSWTCARKRDPLLGNCRNFVCSVGCPSPTARQRCFYRADCSRVMCLCWSTSGRHVCLPAWFADVDEDRKEFEGNLKSTSSTPMRNPNIASQYGLSQAFPPCMVSRVAR